jgi:rhamnose utilization protein RhaD (predicted bifunctional aldolase and dehydrogenase)/NAD(P)-dependent dehydrogenase (short-subunit alcohol dehydrogenase family)
MKSLWSDQEAAAYPGDLGQRVYSSRLLGRDKSLVMHGGGNTSVKLTEINILGEPEELLYVKGSGWDLESIEAAGFSPVKMKHLLGLAKLDALSDSQMANELKANMTRASAPAPSVEAILHAILPHKYVDHTHADAIISITNTANGRDRIQEIYGKSIVIIPYIMPGFKLARLCAQIYPAEATSETVGMVLLNHGIFSFGATAQESYERMIDLVTRAEEYLAKHNAWTISIPEVTPRDSGKQVRPELAALRRIVSEVAGFPMIMATHSDAQSLYFASRSNVADISQQGLATPDHVIRTKRVPQLGRDIQTYRQAYETYFNEHASRADQPLTMLDPAPRVILDPELGMIALGQTAKDAAIVEDIYRHTMDIILRAEALGGWQALPAQDIFDVEYWELEQAKLQKAGKSPVFTGEIALITGAASGIGKACVDSMLARGAAVVGLDINPNIKTLYKRPDFLGVQCDITSESNLDVALEATARAFGGLDMLVLNAGIFPASRRIESLNLAEWQRVMRVNLDANLTLMSAAYPLLKLSPRSGRVAVIGSKNVPAPGPGAAAYSASKAALNQLARIAALEWGADGIRVNIVHPNAVFDTGLWTEELLKTRAEHYKMTVEEYKRNNVLRVSVTSHDVAEMAAEMCGPLFAKTTGAQVPLDGGNERVI